ncbi:MAG: hypothetical protein KAK00_03625 [Nanoarchaeota archaeon]|nr:hypothetical protein [Nanoarchaeota archaeon]
MAKDWSNFVRNKIKEYEYSNIRFTKVKMIDWLERRNKSTVSEMKEEVHTSSCLKFVDKQEVSFKGTVETRY